VTVLAVLVLMKAFMSNTCTFQFPGRSVNGQLCRCFYANI